MPTHDELIRGIHRSGYQCVLAITGGGASAIGELLRVPGGSASVLEAVVPYCWPALVEWLGGAPDQACSAATARAMAMAAWQRARKLADAATATEHLIGLGCTASLASDRPKRGEHRFFVAMQTHFGTKCIGMELQKGARTRAEEEAIVASVIVHELAGQVSEHAPDGYGLMEELPEYRGLHSDLGASHIASPEERALMFGEISALLCTGGNVMQVGLGESLAGRIVLPGAFHPVHQGHRAMAAAAEGKFQKAPIFELSITNVDKPPLDYFEIAERLSKFSAQEAICLTRAPTFVEKSRVFPNATFLVVADTIVRIGDPKYYGGDAAARDAALAALAKNGSRFLVFGRAVGSDFKTLDDLPLPPALRELCDQVSEDEFRADVSSTKIRRQQEQQQQ